MVRITEDLIDLLIGHNIINFTDFPEMAQAEQYIRTDKPGRRRREYFLSLFCRVQVRIKRRAGTD